MSSFFELLEFEVWLFGAFSWIRRWNATACDNIVNKSLNGVDNVSQMKSVFDRITENLYSSCLFMNDYLR